MKRWVLAVALVTLCLNNFAAAQETTNPIRGLWTWVDL